MGPAPATRALLSLLALLFSEDHLISLGVHYALGRFPAAQSHLGFRSFGCSRRLSHHKIARDKSALVCRHVLLRGDGNRQALQQRSRSRNPQGRFLQLHPRRRRTGTLRIFSPKRRAIFPDGQRCTRQLGPARSGCRQKRGNPASPQEKRRRNQRSRLPITSISRTPPPESIASKPTSCIIRSCAPTFPGSSPIPFSSASPANPRGPPPPKPLMRCCPNAPKPTNASAASHLPRPPSSAALCYNLAFEQWISTT